MRQHPRGRRVELGGGDALGEDAEGEGRDLGVGGLARHDLVHGEADALGGNLAASADEAQDLPPVGLARVNGLLGHASLLLFDGAAAGHPARRGEMLLAW